MRPHVWDLVGNTPLVELTRLNPHRSRGVRVLAKLEKFNPGGSVKDRPALSMMEDGIRQGLLTKEKTLVDATSGNTGIAYALLGAAAGLPVRLFMPDNASVERKRLLASLGADVVLTDPLEGQDGAIEQVRKLVEGDPDPWFYPDQYSNPANPLSHVRTTGPEIAQQTNGAVTHVVCGLGTTGTAMGLATYFTAERPDVEVAGVEPDGPMHGLEGLKHLETSLVPAIFDADSLHHRLAVASERAVELTQRLAREEGLLVGPSSGAALAGALDLAEDATDATIVVVFPDGGERYLSEPVFAAAEDGSGAA